LTSPALAPLAKLFPKPDTYTTYLVGDESLYRGPVFYRVTYGVALRPDSVMRVRLKEPLKTFQGGSVIQNTFIYEKEIDG
jgi:hypothetical protein